MTAVSAVAFRRKRNPETYPCTPFFSLPFVIVMTAVTIMASTDRREHTQPFEKLKRYLASHNFFMIEDKWRSHFFRRYPLPIKPLIRCRSYLRACARFLCRRHIVSDARQGWRWRSCLPWYHGRRVFWKRAQAGSIGRPQCSEHGGLPALQEQGM